MKRGVYMDELTKSYFEDLKSKDKSVQYEAFHYILKSTEKKVDWSYDVWGQLKEELTDRDNHKRSRAAQFLSNLAISDPEKRILTDFPALWEVTKDPKFVTARHSLQAIWKVGLAGEAQKELVMSHLVERFNNCENEIDIVQGLRRLYDALKDEEVKQKALDLISSEEDDKYRKKYATVWKNT